MTPYSKDQKLDWLERAYIALDSGLHSGYSCRAMEANGPAAGEWYIQITCCLMERDYAFIFVGDFIPGGAEMASLDHRLLWLCFLMSLVNDNKDEALTIPI